MVALVSNSVNLEFIKLVARTLLLHCFNGGSDDTAPLLLLQVLLKIGSDRMLDMIACFRPLVWLGCSLLPVRR
jgi:hypothetical protein